MTTAAAMEMTTAHGGKDVWRRRQSTAAAVNSISSQRGWQPTGVAVDGGGGRRGQRQQGQMSRVDGLLSGWRSGGGESSVLRSPTLHLVQTKTSGRSVTLIINNNRPLYIMSVQEYLK